MKWWWSDEVDDCKDNNYLVCEKDDNYDGEDVLIKIIIFITITTFELWNNVYFEKNNNITNEKKDASEYTVKQKKNRKKDKKVKRKRKKKK